MLDLSKLLVAEGLLLKEVTLGFVTLYWVL
jgi:hypothetical protein